jgi:3-dehydroquinate dehydratase/shikimate dehydrogenase
MTYLCVPIFVFDHEQASNDLKGAVSAGADMVELRVDIRDDEFTEAFLRKLVHDCPLPCIMTCRPASEGGNSDLPDSARLGQLAIGVDAGAAYIDVELRTYEKSSGDVPTGSRLILSAHDFKGRPDRMYNLISEMAQSRSDVNKVVWMTRSIRENLEAFEILRQRQKPTIALCMGEAGLISRVLAKKFDAFLTFASLRDESATAPGQVTVHDMKRLYRWDAINTNTKVYGVVASPVMHSMSPAIHNAGFDAVGHDGVYLPMLVNRGYESFKAFMESFLAFEPLHLSGLSITIPHKENALRYLKEKGAEIEELAERIGAVNTIIIDRDQPSPPPSPGVPGEGVRPPQHPSPSPGPREEMKPHASPTRGDPGEGRGEGIRLRGVNTDYAAILDTITTSLNITRAQLAEKRIAVLGAGGTGRTAVAALAGCGATVVVYNRTKQRADELAREFNGRRGRVVSARIQRLRESCCQVLINTTSVGMHPNVDESPLGDAPPAFAPDTLVFDTIYNPMETKLIRQAKAAGAKTVGGVEMFVRQAARQFEAWTQKAAPIDIMRSVIEARLSS